MIIYLSIYSQEYAIIEDGVLNTKDKYVRILLDEARQM